MDIRTDSGYVLQTHPDPLVVERDYNRILELQSQILVVANEDDHTDLAGAGDEGRQQAVAKEIEKQTED